MENICEAVVLGADIAAAPRGFFPGLIWTALDVLVAGGSTPAPPTKHHADTTLTD